MGLRSNSFMYKFLISYLNIRSIQWSVAKQQCVLKHRQKTHIRCHSILPYSIFATDASFFLLLLLDDSIRICGIDFHQMIGVETLPTIHLHFGDRLVSKIFQDICKTMDDKMAYKSVGNRRRRPHVRFFGHLQQIKWMYNPRLNMSASGSISMFVSFYCWLSLHAICLRSTWKW